MNAPRALCTLSLALMVLAQSAYVALFGARQWADRACDAIPWCDYTGQRYWHPETSSDVIALRTAVLVGVLGWTIGFLWSLAK